MPSFPTSVFAPATKTTGQIIQAAHVNDLQDEVVAIEGGYLNATARLNSSNSTVNNLSVVGGSTFNTMQVSGTSTFSGAATFNTMQVSGNSTFAGAVTFGSVGVVTSLSVSGVSTFAGNISLDGNQVIRRNTSDGSDNGFIDINGGGAAAVSRGAWIRLNGNEAAGDSGNLSLLPGNAGGQIKLFQSDGVTVAMAVDGASGGVRVGGASTTLFAMMQRYLVEFTVPALSSGASAESTVTVTGLTTNSVLMLQPRTKLNSTVTGVSVTARCSTANELVIEIHNISQSSLSGSTHSAYLLQFSF